MGGGGGGGQTRVQMHEGTVDTADDCRKHDTRQALVGDACVRICLWMKIDKIWVVHWAPEALKLMNCLSD